MLGCYMGGNMPHTVILAFITAVKSVSLSNNPYLRQHKLQSANSNVHFSGPILLGISATPATVMAFLLLQLAHYCPTLVPFPPLWSFLLCLPPWVCLLYPYCIYLLLLFFREREQVRVEHLFVVPLIYVFIGSFLYPQPWCIGEML